VKGRWFKHTYPSSPPLPLRKPPPDNRWQRGQIIDALYLADSEQTAWAEWYRHLAEAMIPPLAQMPRELWTWQVEVDVADLSTIDKLSDVGLEAPTPARRGWPACQRLGERLAAEGWAGLLAPSAARPDGKILCLFRARNTIRGAKPLPPPRLIEQPPPPPTGLRT
jgi:RES domain-containing protein